MYDDFERAREQADCLLRTPAGCRAVMVNAATYLRDDALVDEYMSMNDHEILVTMRWLNQWRAEHGR